MPPVGVINTIAKESDQSQFQQGVWRTSGPKDRTPGLPGSDKKS